MSVLFWRLFKVLVGLLAASGVMTWAVYMWSNRIRDDTDDADSMDEQIDFGLHPDLSKINETEVEDGGYDK